MIQEHQGEEQQLRHRATHLGGHLLPPEIHKFSIDILNYNLEITQFPSHLFPFLRLPLNENKKVLQNNTQNHDFMC